VAVVETFGGASTSSVLKADTPSSFNLNFQTGIAANTLLFGSVRSVQWTQTDVKPNVFATNAQRSLKKFTSDVVTYNLGVARKVTDQWLGFVTYGTEASEGGTAGPLGPTDGFSKMGLGVTYSGEQADITVAMQKVNNGDTSMDGATMSGNTTLVTAVKVAYKF
jgi:long-subunit fatty acid transport protein